MDDGKATQLLDALCVWVLEQVAESPIRSSGFDEAILRAEARAQVEAVEVYRSSRSLQAGLLAGQRTFTLDLQTSHLAPPVNARGEGSQWIPDMPLSVAVGIDSVG